MGEAAGAGQQAERAASQADDLAIADLGRRPGQPITALPPAHRLDQPGAPHLGKDDGQELRGKILLRRDLRQLHRTFTISVGKVKERPDCIPRPLRKHRRPMNPRNPLGNVAGRET
jgi:hypothetical protein